MEDYILREIDRLGEMLLMIARRLGLLDGDTPDYSLSYLDGKGYYSFRLHSLSNS